MALGGEGLWCGASLRPWQILHSRLARMHTCALLERDVWELMDETVEAASPLRENGKKEEVQNLEGDDGELWRHGGLMEARIRDWLTSKIEEERQEAILHPYYYTSSARFSSEFSGTDWGWDDGLGEQIAGDHEADEHGSYINGDNTVATCSSDFSETWDCTTYWEEAVYEAVAGALHSHVNDDELHAEEDEEEVEEEHPGYIGANMANAAILAAPLDTLETHYCQFSQLDLQASEYKAGEHEEDDALCAVCLEPLNHINEEQLQLAFSVNYSNIARLPCRHSFHSSCLSPWLSASACCPCCRAPTSPLQLEAPPNMGLLEPANCSDRVQLDMMGLLAEMEAALDRFGLLS